MKRPHTNHDHSHRGHDDSRRGHDHTGRGHGRTDRGHIHFHHDAAPGRSRRGRGRFGGPDGARSMRGGRRGDPPWMRDEFGPEGPRRGGRRARRGDVRAAIVALLAERPMHGYEMIQELGDRTGGTWTPSPGSIYPTLQMLEETGLIEAVDADGKKQYALTDAGRQDPAATADTAPWEQFAEDAGPAGFQLRNSLGALMPAIQQIIRHGSRPQQAAAAELVDGLRKQLYGLLAEDPADTAATSDPATPGEA